MPGIAHPYTLFCAAHCNAVGIHAAERGNIQCECWRVVAVAILGFQDRLTICRNMVFPCRNGQLFGMQVGIEGDGTANQRRIVGVCAVIPFAGDVDVALINEVTLDFAIFDKRFTGREQGIVSIDKSTAIAGDACGVGDNDICPFPCHFNKAIKLAGVVAVDFIENDVRFTFCQPGVGLHHTA